jgi:hypothetical protein
VNAQNYPGGNVYQVRGQGAAVGMTQATSAWTSALVMPGSKPVQILDVQAIRTSQIKK